MTISTPSTRLVFTRLASSGQLPSELRRHEEDIHGYGGQKFPKLVRTAKTTKKQILRLKCKECGKIVTRLGIRLRKLEIEQ